MLHRPRTAALAALAWSLAVLVAARGADAAQAACGEPESITGTVVALASSVRQEGNGAGGPPSVSLLLRTEEGLVGVTLVEDAQVTTSGGQVIAPGDIPLSSRVCACGRQTSPMQFEATSIKLLP